MLIVKKVYVSYSILFKFNLILHSFVQFYPQSNSEKKIHNRENVNRQKSQRVLFNFIKIYSKCDFRE